MLRQEVRVFKKNILKIKICSRAFSFETNIFLYIDLSSCDDNMYQQMNLYGPVK